MNCAFLEIKLCKPVKYCLPKICMKSKNYSLPWATLYTMFCAREKNEAREHILNILKKDSSLMIL